MYGLSLSGFSASEEPTLWGRGILMLEVASTNTLRSKIYNANVNGLPWGHRTQEY